MERYDGPYLYVPVKTGPRGRSRPRFSVEQIVHVVEALTRKHGAPPTAREVASAIGCKSHYAATLLLRRGISAGRLKRDPKAHRGILVVGR